MVQTERRTSQVFRYNNVSNSAPQKKCSVYRVPIILEWTKGQVVTETTTEYREATDDSGFSDFGNSGSASSNFPGLTSTSDFGSNFQTSSKVESSDSSSDEEEETEEKFQKEAIEAHNDYRVQHGVSKLKLDAKLCSYAKDWATKLAKADSFEHRQNQDFGENLFCCWSSDPKAKCPGKKPVDSWYSEIKKYNFGSEPTSTASGHFTQLVWKNTKKMGIAKAKTKNGKVIVVANYEPAGNWIGQYKDNVPPPINQ